MSNERSNDQISMPSVTSHLVELADELRTVAGLRSRNAIRDRVFPSLTALLPEDSREDPERRYAALQELIEAGLAAMPGGDHRTAAIALLAYDKGRWRPLTKRGSEAAASFGLGWDAYRRRRESTGSSLVVETMTELAGALDREQKPLAPPSLSPSRVAPETTRSTVAPVHLTADPIEPPVAQPTVARSNPLAWTRRPALLGAVALLLVIVAAGAVFRWTTGRTSVEPVNCGNLTNEPGEEADGAGNEITRWSGEFAAMGRDLPDRSGACAGVMSQRSGVIYQEVSAGISSGVSVLVVADDGSGEVVALDHQGYFRYRAEAWDPEVPAPGIGVPIRRVDRDDDLRTVEFTNGILVQEVEEAPAVAVVGARWTRWLDEGGFDGELGAPVSNVYDVAGVGRVQEFFDGNLQADYRSGSIEVVQTTPDDLQLPDGYVGALLVSRGTATAWFVDDDGIRHWLPTTSDFGCIKEFHKAEQHVDVPHAAIARLPAGKASRCR